MACLRTICLANGQTPQARHGLQSQRSGGSVYLRVSNAGATPPQLTPQLQQTAKRPSVPIAGLAKRRRFDVVKNFVILSDGVGANALKVFTIRL